MARAGASRLPNSELIKLCPMCRVAIKKYEGVAQMKCKRCKHMFCWYCLASLDDDVLLRHYGKGPCRHKLGYSRASMLWRRVKTVCLFAGHGLVLLVVNSFFILAAPSVVYCECRHCNTNTKNLENRMRSKASVQDKTPTRSAARRSL